LLDALIGVALIGFIMISCLYVFSEAINKMDDVKKETRAVFLAHSKMEELKAEIPIAATDGGDFGDLNPGYTWTSVSSQLQTSNFYILTQLKVDVLWQARGTQRDYYLQTIYLQRKK